MRVYLTGNTSGLMHTSPVAVHLQDGMVSLKELQAMLHEASKEFSHLEEHARFLEAKNKRCACVLATLRLWHCIDSMHLPDGHISVPSVGIPVSIDMQSTPIASILHIT